MDFFIKRNSNLPTMTMELVEHGFMQDFTEFYNRIQNATVTFTMEDYESCIPKIKCSPAQVLERETYMENCPSKFYVAYTFTQRQTSKKGKYKGTFEITFLDNNEKLVVPIKEELIIHVI